MDFSQQDLIDSYLRGELSGKDLASFEHQMRVDPAFKEEVQFERIVNQGISEYRKAELKSRLNALDVTSDVIGYGAIGSNTLLKTVGGAVSAVVLGVLTYYAVDNFLRTGDEPASTNYITDVYYPQKLIIPGIDVPEPEEISLYTDKEEGADEPMQISASGSSKNELSEASPVLEEDEKEEFIPEVKPPDLTDISSEEAIDTEDLSIPDLSANDQVSKNNQPLDIQTIEKKYEELRYRYLDGKLYLYGNFGEQPYEILEINKADERRIYVYHNNQYYQVSITDDVQKLPLINNQELISELEILRNNKIAE